MTAVWNPFTVVSHNEHRTARIVFHAAHVAIGLLVGLVAFLIHAPVAWTVAVAFLAALVDKCIWVDWHRTSGTLLHWTGLHGLDDPWHFASDAGLTILGAVAFSVPWWQLCLAYYPISVVNDT